MLHQRAGCDRRGQNTRGYSINLTLVSKMGGGMSSEPRARLRAEGASARSRRSFSGGGNGARRRSGARESVWGSSRGEAPRISLERHDLAGPNALVGGKHNPQAVDRILHVIGQIHILLD